MTLGKCWVSGWFYPKTWWATKILNAENNIVPRIDQDMSPAAAVVVIALMSSLTVSSMGFFPFASAFVNIVSPSKGEAVPAGSTLTISGTSDDTAQTNYNVQIIVDDNRPYQDTIPVSPGDYSEWTFVVNPQYVRNMLR
jgi:hypothetical protein